ncbi:MAG: hypothetical protein IKL35_02380, partial [Muribaculaceae bacterium]|nr:hypothetical protein [Muribaculaceae bacterium]
RPASGLGETGNAQRVSTVCVATDRNDGMSLDLWVAVNGQGVAYYYYNGKKEENSSIEEIFTEEESVAPVEYYNLQGMKVANPQGGIFIKVQGNKVTKEYIK